MERRLPSCAPHAADRRTAGPLRRLRRAGAALLRTLLEGFAYQGEPSAYRGSARGGPSAHLPPDAFVNFLQNHDQIGNRPDAARLWRLLERARHLAAATLLALLPTPILLFMGDEFDAPSAFPFFCDFPRELGDAVTEGRCTEFARLWQDADRPGVPAPTTEAARLAAVLDWSALEREPHRGALGRARERLAVRRRELFRACPRAPRPENYWARPRSSLPGPSPTARCSSSPRICSAPAAPFSLNAALRARAATMPLLRHRQRSRCSRRNSRDRHRGSSPLRRIPAAAGARHRTCSNR